MAQRRNEKRDQKIPETNENGNITYKNLWDVVKAVLRGKIIVINAYLKKRVKSPINNPSSQLKELEKDKRSPKLVDGRQ